MKFTRSDIQDILQSGAGLDIRKARELTGRIIDALTAAIIAGKVIELRGPGALEARGRKEYKARNPKTGEAVIVPPRRRVLFRPGAGLKTALRCETAPRTSRHEETP